MPCPICEKRPPKRFCPAKGEQICAICCGSGREVTIDCPIDCSYLIAAHRYEAEHRAPISVDEFPYREIEFPVEFVYERWPVVAGTAGTILRFQAEHRLMTDRTAELALAALAETYRTLGTGIIYERPPDEPLARNLYAHVSDFLNDFRTREADRAGLPALKDSDIFRLLVFFLRIIKQESNGRPLSRACLAFLRDRFPQAVAERHPSRIIVP